MFLTQIHFRRICCYSVGEKLFTVHSVHQTFVWWVLYNLYKFVKFPIKHLGLAIGDVRCVRRFLPTLGVSQIFYLPNFNFFFHYQKGSNALQWRHNEHDSVWNHQPHDCLLNRLFRRRSKKTSKLHNTGLCVGNSPGPVNSLHKRPVTRKMFPFDDVIMGILRKNSSPKSTCPNDTGIILLEMGQWTVGYDGTCWAWW